MTTTTHPDKVAIREYMERRTHAPLDPPPTGEEIRRQLGWFLIPQNRQPDKPDAD